MSLVNPYLYDESNYYADFNRTDLFTNSGIPGKPRTIFLLSHDATPLIPRVIIKENEKKPKWLIGLEKVGMCKLNGDPKSKMIKKSSTSKTKFRRNVK